VPGF